MNIDNTELLEALKQTRPPKPEMTSGDKGDAEPRDQAEGRDGE